MTGEPCTHAVGGNGPIRKREREMARPVSCISMHAPAVDEHDVVVRHAYVVHGINVGSKLLVGAVAFRSAT
jgi:carbonic anhydrase/acetyltransferase-like protein (isoleucine patch superfamily)